MRILEEPKNAIIKQYQKYFDLEKVRLKFTDDAVAAIAREALKRGTGARGLRAILEEVMLEIMYELPSIQGLKECVITREVILNRERPVLVSEAKEQTRLSGTLFVVATPIGNLEDITLRALRVLREVDLIACEDTRRTRALLTHFDIHTPTVSYYEHNKLTRGPAAPAPARGRPLGRAGHRRRHARASPTRASCWCARRARPACRWCRCPGRRRSSPALSAAGVPADRFVFDGFLPVKPGRRLNRLKALRELETTVVLYESPHRIVATLEAIGEVFGERRDRGGARAHQAVRGDRAGHRRPRTWRGLARRRRARRVHARDSGNGGTEGGPEIAPEPPGGEGSRGSRGAARLARRGAAPVRIAAPRRLPGRRSCRCRLSMAWQRSRAPRILRRLWAFRRR